MARRKIEDIVHEFTLPILEQLGYELVDVEYKKEGSNWYLRVYIDKEQGITIDDCQQASENISAKLDEVDPIPHNYFLEVSSPGLDRPLKKEKDFDKYKGYQVDVKLYKPVNGKKSFTGELVGLEDGKIIIKLNNDDMISFEMTGVAIVKLAIEF